LRDYQSVKNNPYLLPDTLYRRVIALIRDYDRLKDEYHEVLHSGGQRPDGQPRGTQVSNPTERKAIRMALISSELKAVEQAIVVIPHEYRNGVQDNVTYQVRYPDDADPRTYRRWKQRFIYSVAANMNYI